MQNFARISCSFLSLLREELSDLDILQMRRQVQLQRLKVEEERYELGNCSEVSDVVIVRLAVVAFLVNSTHVQSEKLS